MASKDQEEPFWIDVKATAMTSSPARFDDFTTESFRRVEFADQTFADGHLIIKSPINREEGPVGP